MNKASIPEDAFIFPLIFTADFASIIDSFWRQSLEGKQITSSLQGRWSKRNSRDVMDSFLKQ